MWVTPVQTIGWAGEIVTQFDFYDTLSLSNKNILAFIGFNMFRKLNNKSNITAERKAK